MKREHAKRKKPSVQEFINKEKQVRMSRVHTHLPYIINIHNVE